MNFLKKKLTCGLSEKDFIVCFSCLSCNNLLPYILACAMKDLKDTSLGPTGSGKRMQEELGTPMQDEARLQGRSRPEWWMISKNQDTRGLVIFPGNQQKGMGGA